VRPFRYYSYGEIVAYLSDLERRFPHLVELTTAQQAYGLGSPGTCKSVDGADVPCESLIMRLTNEETLPEPERPEVFFSGCLHGNEYVGPITTVEMAIALVEHYETSEWARRMLNTRSIYIMPFPNSIGYEKRTRSEINVDPNRDFPYNQKRCLKTVTARALCVRATRAWRVVCAGDACAARVLVCSCVRTCVRACARACVCWCVACVLRAPCVQSCCFRRNANT
jgi:hypothetical protein